MVHVSTYQVPFWYWFFEPQPNMRERPVKEGGSLYNQLPRSIPFNIQLVIRVQLLWNERGSLVFRGWPFSLVVGTPSAGVSFSERIEGLKKFGLGEAEPSGLPPGVSSDFWGATSLKHSLGSRLVAFC